MKRRPRGRDFASVSGVVFWMVRVRWKRSAEILVSWSLGRPADFMLGAEEDVIGFDGIDGSLVRENEKVADELPEELSF